MLSLCRNLVNSLILLTVILLTVIIGGAASADDVAADDVAATYRLRYRFAAGETIHYIDERSTTITLRYGESVEHVEHAVNSHKSYRLISVDEQGTATLESTVDAAVMTAGKDGEVFTYDSRSGKAPPEAFGAVHGNIGKPLARVKLSPTGEVMDFGPAESTRLTAGTDAAERFDVLPLLPSEPVAVDDAWKDVFQVSVQASQEQPALRRTITLHRIYKLLSVTNGLATIDQRTVVITPLRDAFQEGQLVQRTPRGTLVFDLERGLLVSRALMTEEEVVGFNGERSIIAVTSRHVESYAPDGKVELTPPRPASAERSTTK